MAATLPKKVPFRREHTGDPAMDRMQRLAQATASAHELTKTIVAALMNRVYAALAVDVTIGIAAYAALFSATITTLLPTGNLDIIFTASGANSTATANMRFLVLVDNVSVGGTYGFTNAGQTFCSTIAVRVPVKAGKHVVTVQWKSDAGAARINAKTVAEEHAHLLLQESI
jgi:hypothetical protein